jgi:hypothetical protein
MRVNPEAVTGVFPTTRHRRMEKAEVVVTAGPDQSVILCFEKSMIR